MGCSAQLNDPREPSDEQTHCEDETTLLKAGGWLVGD